MIYHRQRKYKHVSGGFYHLEEEKSKTRVSGYGEGDQIKMKDEYGNTWLGTAERSVDNSIVYRFRGISNNTVVTLRDEKGRTWKGFVD
jgi:formylmethanofuran dehydrogenase subunit D